MVETIQERVRNMVGSFHNMKTLFRNIANEEDYEKRMKFVNYILNNSECIIRIIEIIFIIGEIHNRKYKKVEKPLVSQIWR